MKTYIASTIVNGILNLAATNFQMVNSTLKTLTLNGTILGSGSLVTANSRLTIGGSGAFGTLRFAVGTSTLINNFTVNRPSGVITLGSSLVVGGYFSY